MDGIGDRLRIAEPTHVLEPVRLVVVVPSDGPAVFHHRPARRNASGLLLPSHEIRKRPDLVRLPPSDLDRRHPSFPRERRKPLETHHLHRDLALPLPPRRPRRCPTGETHHLLHHHVSADDSTFLFQPAFDVLEAKIRYPAETEIMILVILIAPTGWRKVDWLEMPRQRGWVFPARAAPVCDAVT